MTSAHYRRIFGVLLLILSLALLAWSLWPLSPGVRTLPVEPTYMQLPTPQGWAPGGWYSAAPVAVLAGPVELGRMWL